MAGFAPRVLSGAGPNSVRLWFRALAVMQCSGARVDAAYVRLRLLGHECRSAGHRLWSMPSWSLPLRLGARPRTTPTNPHTQLDQQPADSRWSEELARRVFALPGVVEAPSGISVPGARALVLAPIEAVGPPEAFLIDREFAHLHPAPDYSLHAMLPIETVSKAVAAGWAEPHPVALKGLIPPNAVMLYAPRDETELNIVERLVRASHAFAHSARPATSRYSR